MKNFEKEGKIVNNEIYVCQTGLVEELLNNGLFEWDNIQNMYIDNSEQVKELQEQKEEIEEQIEELKEQIEQIEGQRQEEEEELIEQIEELERDIEKLDKQIEQIEGQIEELKEEEKTPNEPIEWWCVSNWLKEKLLEYNEPILENDFGTWWGRCTTGQSIKLDWVIQEIAK